MNLTLFFSISFLPFLARVWRTCELTPNNIGIQRANGSCIRFIFVLAEDMCITSRESPLKWLLVSRMRGRENEREREWERERERERETRGQVRRAASDVITNAFLTTYILHPFLFFSFLFSSFFFFLSLYTNTLAQDIACDFKRVRKIKQRFYYPSTLLNLT